MKALLTIILIVSTAIPALARMVPVSIIPDPLNEESSCGLTAKTKELVMTPPSGLSTTVAGEVIDLPKPVTLIVCSRWGAIRYASPVITDPIGQRDADGRIISDKIPYGTEVQITKVVFSINFPRLPGCQSAYSTGHIAYSPKYGWTGLGSYRYPD